jgi:hypothetical protein
MRQGFRLSLVLSVANGYRRIEHGRPRAAPGSQGSADGTHPWPAGRTRPSSVPSLAPVISTGASRTFPQDLHNSPGGRADRPTPVPGGVRSEHVVVSAQKSVPCLATVLVDEAPAPARSREDPWTTP